MCQITMEQEIPHCVWNLLARSFEVIGVYTV